MRTRNRGLKYDLTLLACISLMCCLSIHCGMDGIAGDKGSSSETTNGIVISATTNELTGSTVPGAEVYICKQYHIPVYGTVSIDTLNADTNGLFTFIIPSPDTYSVTVIVPDSTVGIYLSGLKLGLEPLDTIRYDSLPATCTISGPVPGATIDQYTMVFLEGTPFYTYGTPAGTIDLPGVPPGDYVVGIIMIDMIPSTEYLPDFQRHPVSVVNDSSIVWRE
jgi:hypothetical protein